MALIRFFLFSFFSWQLAFVHSRDLIANDTPVKEGQFPFVVAVTKNNKVVCTGSIISENSILTAAHCVTGYSRSIKVVVGTLNWRNGGETMAVKSVKRHPKYKSKAHLRVKDIAIITLKKNINENYFKPVLLSAKDNSDEIVNRSVTQTGWVRPNIDKLSIIPNEELMTNESTLISKDTCIDEYKEGITNYLMDLREETEELGAWEIILNLMDRLFHFFENFKKKLWEIPGTICANSFGYIGDPMTVSTSDGVVQIGIGSFIGNNDGSTQFYTSVAAYADFIDKYSKGHKWHEGSTSS